MEVRQLATLNHSNVSFRGFMDHVRKDVFTAMEKTKLIRSLRILSRRVDPWKSYIVRIRLSWKKIFFYFTLEAVVDAWRKVRRLQFPWQTNVFSAPLNSSFSRSAANSTFHDPSVRDRRKRLVACKAAFSASAREKGYPYRISMERKVRDGRVESSDRVPKTERAIQGNRFIQSHRRSSAIRL